MKNNILYVVIVLFFATSCSSDNKPKDLSLNIETENPDVINLMRSIDSVSVISLKNTDGGFIGELAEILILDNHYYIYDDMRFAIRKYTKTGEYVKEFMKKGRANNEYMMIDDIVCDSTHIYILTGFKFFVLNKDLEIEYTTMLKDIKGVEKGVFIDRISNYKDNILLYSHYTQTIYTMPKKTYEAKKMFKDDRDLSKNQVIGRFPFSINNNIFYPINENIMLVNMCASDNIYKIENGEVSLWKIFEYSEKEATYKRMLNDNSRESFHGTHIPYIHDLVVLDNKYIIDYGSRIIVYDTMTGESKDYTTFPEDTSIENLLKVFLSWEASKGNILFNYSGTIEKDFDIDDMIVRMRERFTGIPITGYNKENLNLTNEDGYDFLHIIIMGKFEFEQREKLNS